MTLIQGHRVSVSSGNVIVIRHIERNHTVMANYLLNLTTVIHVPVQRVRNKVLLLLSIKCIKNVNVVADIVVIVIQQYCGYYHNVLCRVHVYNFEKLHVQTVAFIFCADILFKAKIYEIASDTHQLHYTPLYHFTI